MSTSISGTVVGEGHMAIENWSNKYLLIKSEQLCLSRLTLVCRCSYLIQGIAELVVIHQQLLIRINQIKKEAQHQFVKLWLTKLCVSSLLQAPRTFALDQNSKPTTLSSSSSQASSTWCKLPHSVERHMKMLVLIFRIILRLVAQFSSRMLLKTSYYFACFHSH